MIIATVTQFKRGKEDFKTFYFKIFHEGKETSLPAKFSKEGKQKNLRITDLQYLNPTSIQKKIIKYNKLRIKEYLKLAKVYNPDTMKEFVHSDTIEITTESEGKYNVYDLLSGSKESKINTVNKFDNPDFMKEFETIYEQYQLHQKDTTDIDEIFEGEELVINVTNEAEKEYDHNLILKKIQREKNRFKKNRLEFKHGFTSPDSIINLFGYALTLTETHSDELLIRKKPQRVPLKVTDYIYCSGASNNLKDFSYKWVEDYLNFIKVKGVSKARIFNYTTLTLNQQETKDKLINAERDLISRESLRDFIKEIKQVIKIISTKTNLLEGYESELIKIKDIRLDNIETRSDRSKINDLEKAVNTSLDHHVNVEELDQLFNFNFKDEKLDKVRNLFIQQVFAGGLRSLYKDKIELLNNNTLKVWHSKTRATVRDLPLFPMMQKIIQKHNGLPENPYKEGNNIKEYNDLLKKCFSIVGLTRKIETVTQKSGQKTQYDYKPLNEKITQNFARHTFYSYMAHYQYIHPEITDSKILQFTGGKDLDILSHYKRKMKATEKEDIVKLIEQS